ncbi:hypothetical protein ACP93_14215 [Xanthomonas sp. NCPPB 1128]|uniref:hypothetical protein n=1 Tax=Xanthomonas sp. NCPPB 1128 TaxID=1775876 RepID=UPI00065A9C4F|nr:hypothetical protein [Xanthomonas sp. NCPPB 1128]KMM74951.1 hypothetical protein ACP93_14215 [Xanthomonas sp. NCPPB 1128]
MRHLLLSTILSGCALGCGVAFAATAPTSPLVSTWVLCEDPDGAPKDSLEFFTEGYGFSRRPSAVMAPVLYKESNGQVLLAVNARGDLITVRLSVPPDHSRLKFKSERTGNVAYYVRAGTEQSAGCTAK